MSFPELIRSACCTGVTLQNEDLTKDSSYKTVFDPGNNIIGFVLTKHCCMRTHTIQYRHVKYDPRAEEVINPCSLGYTAGLDERDVQL